MEKFKLILAIFFLALGLGSAYLTFRLYNSIITMGEVKNDNLFNRSLYQSQYMDSPGDGVAIGFGIISGFSFLSGTLLLTSMKKREE